MARGAPTSTRRRSAARRGDRCDQGRIRDPQGCRSRLAEFLGHAAHGEVAVPGRRTVGDYVDEWLAGMRMTLDVSAWTNYRSLPRSACPATDRPPPATAVAPSTLTALYGDLLAGGGKNGKSLSVEPGYAMRLLEEHPVGVGYLLKERIFDAALLVDGIRRVAEGVTVVDPTIVARLLSRKRRDDPLAALTDREREVLALVSEGLSNRGIADRLVITERTVEAHVKSIMIKLGLDTDPRIAPASSRGTGVPAPLGSELLLQVVLVRRSTAPSPGPTSPPTGGRHLPAANRFFR